MAILLNGKPLQDAAKPKAPAQPTTPPAALGVPRPPLPASPGVALTPTNPANDLRGQTIGVGPTANREQLAQQYTKNWNAASEPYFQRDLRQATSNAAARGQIGSGQLRTSLGDLTLNRDIQRDAATSNFLTNALQGSIDDAYRNVGIAQQQQAFQSGLQNQTFNQDLQRFLAGTSGNPSGAETLAANQASDQANAAQSAFMQYLQSLGRGPATTPQTVIPGLPQGVQVGDPIYTGVYG